MDDSTKQVAYIVIIVAALGVAGSITFWTQRSNPTGPESIDPDEMTWVICEECGATYEMQLRKYYQLVEENMEPMMLTAPPLECKECGAKAIYRAAKCEECGHIFRRGTVPNDFADRCPECGYSHIEEMRRRKAQERK